MTTTSIEQTDGYLVTDTDGRIVGKVECSLYGSARDAPDALAVRSGHVFRRHFLVPAGAVDVIDDRHRVVGLRLERRDLRQFL